MIFSNLIFNEEFGRKTLPFIHSEYFQDISEKVVYDLIDSYVKKYNSFPTKEAMFIDLSNKDGLNEDLFNRTKEYISAIEPVDVDFQWMTDKTEKFCQEKAIYNAIMKSIQIIDDKNESQDKGAIPKILSDAIAVSFDNHVGHDFIEDANSRFEFYQKKEMRIPFDLDYLNKITKGGLPSKTLNIVLAGTGVGKSLFMCHCAASNLLMGQNVLYITMEMAEERIAERIDANLLDIPVDELMTIPKTYYDKKLEKVKSKVKGRLIIKEYPTACAGSANFRHLLNELKIKRNFIPDIIYIDYLNICISSRLKYTSSVNSYTLVKAIAEELRGLAVEFNVPIVSATQTTRSGYKSSDIELTDTSESFGLPATADLMIAIQTSEDLEQLNQLMVKQLKNRYSDPSQNKKFVVGVDRSKMRLYNVEQSAQEDLLDGPVMDNTKFGEEDHERSLPKSKFNKSAFEGFK
jgi:archaellum biogenesis ATPase FlaH